MCWKFYLKCLSLKFEPYVLYSTNPKSYENIKYSKLRKNNQNLFDFWDFWTLFIPMMCESFNILKQFL